MNDLRPPLRSTAHLVRLLHHGTLAVLRPDGQDGVRLGPWPGLASEVLGADGTWRPSEPATREVERLFLAPQGGAFANLPRELGWRSTWEPRFASTPGGWAQRADGQGLFPFVVEPPELQDELTATRCWELVDAYRRSLPPEFHEAIASFPGLPVPLLRILAAEPRFLALVRGNPTVAQYLAEQHRAPSTDALPRDLLRDLSRASRRALMEALGLPPSSYGFLARLPAADVQPRAVPNLGRATQQSGIGACLLHLKVVPVAVLDLVASPANWPVLTPDLIHQVARCSLHPDPSIALGARMFALQLTQWRNRTDPSSDCTPLRGMGELAPLLEDERRQQEAGLPERPLPPPPLPGSRLLVALTTADEIRQEGREQQNCAGSRRNIAGVKRGERYFYRTLDGAPARLTVMIERHAGSSPWVIREVRGFANELPGFGTVRWVTTQLRISANPVWLPAGAVFVPPGLEYPIPYVPEPTHPASSQPADDRPPLVPCA